MCGETGIDIIPVARIAKLIRERGDIFLHRWFTTAEIEYCSRKAVPSRHYAARFAAKEAVAKVLPFHPNGPLPWRSIEIVNNAHGAPIVRLSGSALEIARRAGVGTIRVSLSHCDEYATAIALTDNTRRTPIPHRT
jgi:holo-[acyl-carrier protein] synthase